MSSLASGKLPTDTINPATLMSGRFKQEQIPDLSGRVAVVTGGSAGIGYHTALALARANAKVTILSANEEHGNEAVKEMNDFLQSHNAKGKVVWTGVDLGDIPAVDEVAKNILKEEERLDILVLNGGIGQAPWGLEKNGIERHFAINNLGHYVITARLLPLMQKTAERPDTPAASVRVVLQSSELHKMAPSDTKFASKEEINRERDGILLYGRTKLGLVYLGQQIAKRVSPVPSSGVPVIAISVHPGTVNTDLQKTWPEMYGVLGKVMEVVTRKVGKSAPEGAEPGLWAATWDGINKESWSDYQGRYYSEAFGKPGKESSLAQNEEVSDNFYNLCVNLTQDLLGEKLELKSEIGDKGWYLPGAAHPYYVLSHQFDIDFASPAGPNPPVDPDSVKNFTDDESIAFLRDEVVKRKLESCKRLADVRADDYAAIFYVGGHGPVIDLAKDPVSIKLASTMWTYGKIVSAVCHGPAALVHVKDSQGKSIFAGKEVTAFSNAEEEQAGKTDEVPFLIETEIEKLGGKYSKATEPWGPCVVTSGKLLTGQNPASARPLAEAVLNALQGQTSFA